MIVDTRGMREMIEAAPGEEVRVEKDTLHRLLDVVDAGQSAALALAGLNRLVPVKLAA